MIPFDSEFLAAYMTFMWERNADAVLPSRRQSGDWTDSLNRHWATLSDRDFWLVMVKMVQL